MRRSPCCQAWYYEKWHGNVLYEHCGRCFKIINKIGRIIRYDKINKKILEMEDRQ